MELGPLQKIWIKSLRENPRRQQEGSLAIFKTPNNLDDYKACCLGEYLLCKLRNENVDLKQELREYEAYEGYSLIDGGELCTGVLSNSFEELKLRSDRGSLKRKRIKGLTSLAEANDSGVSWSEIADFIEDNPNAVFTGSI